jgi:hypothetical protein
MVWGVFEGRKTQERRYTANLHRFCTVEHGNGLYHRKGATQIWLDHFQAWRCGTPQLLLPHHAPEGRSLQDRYARDGGQAVSA